MDSILSLQNRLALVTGAASGIGLETAKILEKLGAQVILLDINSEQCREAVKHFSNALAHEVDVSDEASVERAVGFANSHGTPDILVNCAGIAIRDDAISLSRSDWDKVVDINMTGTFLMSRSVARSMMKSESGGSIVQTASIMGLSGGGIYPNISYQTTKGAIVNMTRSLAVEWAGANIRVNAVAPTYVHTPFIEPLMQDQEIVDKIIESTPLGRLARVEEVAKTIAFLASPAASMITGHCLPVDGGYLCQ